LSYASVTEGKSNPGHHASVEGRRARENRATPLREAIRGGELGAYDLPPRAIRPILEHDISGSQFVPNGIGRGEIPICSGVRPLLNLLLHPTGHVIVHRT